MSKQPPISEILGTICDRIEGGEFDGKSLADQTDAEGFRHTLAHTWVERFERIERAVPAEDDDSAAAPVLPPYEG